MKKIQKRSHCPISYALDFFGDKWTFLIIRDLALKGRHFYKEFLEAGEGIATNVLSDRLKRLEMIGIVNSAIYPEQKTKKVYTLTQKGKDLVPILVEMILWSAKYDADTEAHPDFVREARRDREGLIKEIQGSIH